jgi:hypothetical protein
MNRFSRNRQLLEKFVVTNSYIQFNKNSTKGLLADTMTQTDGQAGAYVVSINGDTCTS